MKKLFMDDLFYTNKDVVNYKPYTDCIAKYARQLSILSTNNYTWNVAEIVQTCIIENNSNDYDSEVNMTWACDYINNNDQINVYGHLDAENGCSVIKKMTSEECKDMVNTEDDVATYCWIACSTACACACISSRTFSRSVWIL